jgi:hypothetical protein
MICGFTYFSDFERCFSGVCCEEEIVLLNLMWTNFSVQGDEIILSILAKTQKETMRVFKVRIL